MMELVKGDGFKTLDGLLSVAPSAWGSYINLRYGKGGGNTGKSGIEASHGKGNGTLFESKNPNGSIISDKPIFDTKNPVYSEAGNDGKRTNATSHFPKDPTDLSKVLGVEAKVTTTQHGTTRMVWEPNSSTRIRYESHPGDSGTFNPRHHGYHIEVKPDNLTWNQAKRQNAIQKVKPEDYKPGHGTGFLPGEKHPGK